MFDWTSGNTYPSANPAFTPAPFLYDGDVAQVLAFLQNQQASGGITAVRINAPISNATAQAIFNNSSVTVKYVFADLENPSTVVSDTAALVAQIQGPSKTNKSSTAFVGNYAIATVAHDPTLAASRGFTGYSLANYRASGVTMSNPELYPGAPDYRGPASGDTTVSGASFPNLRSSLFILPIERLSFAAQNNAPGTPLIPYAARFENFGNAALQNTSLPNGVHGFTPGVASGSLTAAQTANQMISRNSFQAEMLHYHLRGATGVHMFEPGVVGYTDAQFESDGITGFNFLNSSAYGFAATTVTPVELGATININGTVQSVEDAGVIASGVSNSNNKMALLISNLTDTNKSVLLPSQIASVAVPANELLAVGADSHNLYEFTNVSGTWHLDSSSVVFNDPTLSSESEVGIPEPASNSILAVGAIALLFRPTRKSRGRIKGAALA